MIRFRVSIFQFWETSFGIGLHDICWILILLLLPWADETFLYFLTSRPIITAAIPLLRQILAFLINLYLEIGGIFFNEFFFVLFAASSLIKCGILVHFEKKNISSTITELKFIVCFCKFRKILYFYQRDTLLVCSLFNT